MGAINPVDGRGRQASKPARRTHDRIRPHLPSRQARAHHPGDGRRPRRRAGDGTRRQPSRRAPGRDRHAPHGGGSQALFQGIAAAPGRAGQAPGLGTERAEEGRRAVRGPRLRRQGRRHQAHHPAPQSPHLPGRRVAGAERARAYAMVFPALRVASAGRRRDGAVRPQLVQSRRRRARDGLLHRRAIPGVFFNRCRNSSGC